MLKMGSKVCEDGDTQFSPLMPRDYEQWLVLWQQYLVFYEEKLPPGITQKTWQRLVDPTFPYYGLGARNQGCLQAFVHFTYHPSSWSRVDVCYIEDMFVDPTWRKQGLARQLMAQVYEIARSHGSDKVYWITQSKNKTAQKLYQQIAQSVDYLRFEKDL